MNKTLKYDLLFGALILWGIYLRLLFGDDFSYSLFSDRDLLRGYYLLDEFQVTGPESGMHVSRNPGGFMSYFLFLDSS